jgi:hypothetical protein
MRFDSRCLRPSKYQTLDNCFSSKQSNVISGHTYFSGRSRLHCGHELWGGVNMWRLSITPLIKPFSLAVRWFKFIHILDTFVFPTFFPQKRIFFSISKCLQNTNLASTGTKHADDDHSSKYATMTSPNSILNFKSNQLSVIRLPTRLTFHFHRSFRRYKIFITMSYLNMFQKSIAWK